MPRVIEPEEIVGEGAGCVYVYFSNSERRLAELENRDRWPCKIGSTKGDVSERILQQRVHTSMARLPVIGLIIRTDQPRALEQRLHEALSLVGNLDKRTGREWFSTSPEEVKRLWANPEPLFRPSLCATTVDMSRPSKTGELTERIRAFFRKRPNLNRTQFAIKAQLHRNTFYGMDEEAWNPRIETVDKLLSAIDEYEAEEAKAQRKTRPSRVHLAVA